MKMYSRKAMTLVELLVVMAIVMMFATMVAVFFPSASSSNQISKYSSTIQNALLGARNRAKSDRLPTGIRFYTGPVTLLGFDITSNNPCLQVVTIQKPQDIRGSNFSGITKEALVPSIDALVRLNPVQAVQAYSPDTGPNISNGDFIKLDTGETCLLRGPASLVFNTEGFPSPPSYPPSSALVNMSVHSGGSGTRPVDRFDISTLSRDTSGGFNSASQIVDSGFWARLSYDSPIYNYTLVRAPRELSSEPPFELDQSINIVLNSASLSSAIGSVSPVGYPSSRTLGMSANMNGSYPYSRTVGIQANPSSGNFYFDIIFNPSGALESSSSGDVLIWLHQIESEIGDYSKDAIIAIRKNNGAIGVYDVGPGVPLGGDPFANAKDPRNKGM